MNDSTSAISPVWPTRWPKDSFKSVWSWLLAGSIAVLFVLLFLVTLVVRVPTHVSAGDLDKSLVAQTIGEGILVAIVLASMRPLSKFSLAQLGFRVPDGRTIAIGLVGAIAMIVVANGTATLVNYFFHTQHQQDVVQIFEGIHDKASIAFFSLFAVIFAPFFEETLFRVFFFNFGMRYGGFWSGAILSGLLFGAAHGDPYEAVPLALGGIVLCAVYYQSRNAYASMISHALFNGVSIVALLAFSKVT